VPLALSIAVHGAALAALRTAAPHPARQVAARVDAPPIDLVSIEAANTAEAPAVRCAPVAVTPPRDPPPARPAPKIAAQPASPSPPSPPAAPSVSAQASAQPPPPAIVTAAGPSPDAAPAGTGTAAGASGGSSSSVAGAPNAAAARGTEHGDGIGAYMRTVQGRLAAVAFYPEQAAREHRQGTVYLRLVLATDGRLLDTAVSGGTPDPILRDAALTAARRAGPFPPLPAALGATGPQAFDGVPLRFYLTEQR
jgi:protein TonB